MALSKSQRPLPRSTEVTQGALHLVIGISFLIGACGDDMPRLAAFLTSEHFDVEIYPGAVMRPDMLDTLEEHYRVTKAFLHFPEGRVTYSLFATVADAQRACGVAPDQSLACAQGNRVLSSNSFDEHELIHAYLSRLANPAPILREGIAQGVRCTAYSFLPVGIAVPPWDTAVSEQPIGQAGIYDAAFLLFIQLVHEFGIDQFMDYYAHAHDTLSADIFRQDFEAAFSVSLPNTWQAMTQSRAGLATINPVCPCTQASVLPADGSPVVLPKLAPWIAGDVQLVPPDRVLPLPDADPGPFLIFAAGGGTALRSCWQDLSFDLGAYDLSSAVGGTLNATQLAPERHYVAVGALTDGTVSLTKGAFIAPTCDAASTITVPGDASGEITIRIASGNPTAGVDWHWRIAVGALTHVSFPVLPGDPTQISVCPTCDESDPACFNVPLGGGSFAFDAMTPELTFHVSNPPDAYTSALHLSLSSQLAPSQP